MFNAEGQRSCLRRVHISWLFCEFRSNLNFLFEVFCFCWCCNPEKQEEWQYMVLDDIRVDSLALSDIISVKQRSVRSQTAVKVRFVNTSPETVDLCWVDYHVIYLFSFPE